MKTISFICLILFTLATSCHSTEPVVNDQITSIDNTTITDTQPKPNDIDIAAVNKATTPSQEQDLSKLNPGVGPVSSLTLLELDSELVTKGKVLFDNNCYACHRVDRDLIGPMMRGVIEKRNPVWIMNMILNSDEMLRVDVDAIALLEKYKTPMVYSACTVDDARAMLEYMRTLTFKK